MRQQLVTQTAVLELIAPRQSTQRLTIPQLQLRKQAPFPHLVTLLLQLSQNILTVQTAVKVGSQLYQYLVESVIFFLHFLMVTATLLSFAALDEDRHGFKYFVGSPEILVDEVLVVQL